MASSPKDPKQQKTKPIRRNDVIHCENCGEDYSVTYNRCPFCDERPAKNGRPRTAGGRRVAGGGRSGRPANPLQVAALVGSLVLIIVAMYIVFTSLAPLFSKGEDDPGGSQADPGASTSQTGPDASSTPSGSQGDISQPEPEPPVTVDVTSLTLDKSDFTLQAGESATIQAAVVPADAEITWSSSDESAATVSPEGVVSNVNTGSSQVKVTITATAGDKTAECIVYCRGGSTPAPGTVTTPSDNNSTGGSTTTPSVTVPSATGTLTANKEAIIVNAGDGLNIRSGPGSQYDVVASAENGSTVVVLEQSGDWTKINYGNGKTGYVASAYLQMK